MSDTSVTSASYQPTYPDEVENYNTDQAKANLGTQTLAIPSTPNVPNYNFQDKSLSSNIVNDEIKRKTETAATFLKHKGSTSPATLAMAFGALTDQAHSVAQQKVAAASTSNSPSALLEAQLAIGDYTTKQSAGQSSLSTVLSDYSANAKAFRIG